MLLPVFMESIPIQSGITRRSLAHLRAGQQGGFDDLWSGNWTVKYNLYLR